MTTAIRRNYATSAHNLLAFTEKKKITLMWNDLVLFVKFRHLV